MNGFFFWKLYYLVKKLSFQFNFILSNIYLNIYILFYTWLKLIIVTHLFTENNIVRKWHNYIKNKHTTKLKIIYYLILIHTVKNICILKKTIYNTSWLHVCFYLFSIFLVLIKKMLLYIRLYKWKWVF